MISDVMLAYASTCSNVAANLIGTYYFSCYIVLRPVKKLSKVKSGTGGALSEEVVTCNEVLNLHLRRKKVTRRPEGYFVYCLALGQKSNDLSIISSSSRV